MELYNFQALQDFLGEIIPPPKNIIMLSPIEFNTMLENGEIEFRRDGIFTKISGKSMQLFLYKYDYKVDSYNLPKAHLIKCSKVSFVGTHHYTAACKEAVDVHNLESNTILINQRLGTCKICLDEILNTNMKDVHTTGDFARFTNEREEDVDKNTPTDSNGYVLNWQQLSKQYRESYHYACAKCTIQITNQEHLHYIHVHHRNGNKLWNADCNLECLCILCHSNVDAHHKQKFQNNMDLKFFKLTYGTKLKELNNPYI